MWSSCLGLITQLQTQSKLAKKADDEHLKKYMVVINVSLKHPTPSVRRAAEELFFTLYEDFGQALESQLGNQKPAVISKLIATA